MYRKTYKHTMIENKKCLIKVKRLLMPYILYNSIDN